MCDAKYKKNLVQAEMVTAGSTYGLTPAERISIDQISIFST
jgi:hypothetical protein